MDKYSYISNAEGDYIEGLYEQYQTAPNTVDPSWQRFFEGYEFLLQKYGEDGPQESTGTIAPEEIRVRDYIHAFRARAHLQSDTNPVRQRRAHKVALQPKDFGLSEADPKTTYEAGKVLGITNTTFREIQKKLSKVYAGPIGFEFMHIRDTEVNTWFVEKAEKEWNNFVPTIKEKKRILSKLNEAVIFENFLHTKYLGQKRFSLEGGENTIPALDAIIQAAGDIHIKEVVIGMAHRGRLNVLSNIMGKTYGEIFNEFEGNVQADTTFGDGDVKYHLGYSSHLKTENGGEVYVKLAPNPSHLEAVDPVVLGYSRAQMDEEYKGDLNSVLPILIHGDAAIAGQGLVYEIVQMSGLPGYHTGGTIHFVINNQVGFTTDYDDARTGIYCTDIAKIVDAPVIHINGDDAEAVYFGAKLALEYRTKFKKDIFIDLLCYRRHGHNESDEPKFTQPKLYNLIAKHANPREIYNKKLIAQGDVNAALAQQMEQVFRKDLQDRLNEVKQKPLPYKQQKVEEEWQSMRISKPEDFDNSPDTSITIDVIEKVGSTLSTIKDGFKPLKQIEKLLKDRKTNFFEKKTLAWADAELLAYGSLLLENKNVRMSGQDVKRGTFSHRHAFIMDGNTNKAYCNLNHLDKNQGKFQIYNSLLSEYGVLGFEYGYAMASPHSLVIWEAQFGDFANGAQVMIDQFITSAYTKWQRQNGLVMLLPHGYEGQGPEHSSARLERFLQSCAGNNMFVCNITTPANLFHSFRRQLAMPFRMPLIIMSPKSLLRHPKVVSPLKDFTHAKFKEIIGDEFAKPKKVKRILLCSGKIYFDLLEFQQKEKRDDVAIIRVEQLHPFPKKQVMAEIKKYNVDKIYWVQEEPENMGAWSFILRSFREVRKEIISRKAAASPATGFMKIHKMEQNKIVEMAFGDKIKDDKF